MYFIIFIFFQTQINVNKNHKCITKIIQKPSIISRSNQQNYLNPLIKVLTQKITKSFTHPNQNKHPIQVQKLLSTTFSSLFRAYPFQNAQSFTNPIQRIAENINFYKKKQFLSVFRQLMAGPERRRQRRRQGVSWLSGLSTDNFARYVFSQHTLLYFAVFLLI